MRQSPQVSILPHLFFNGFEGCVPKIFPVVHIFIVFCVFCGCAQREESDSASERVNATIQDVCHRLNAGGAGLGSGVEFEKINTMFECVSNSQRRIELANAYAANILSVDLVGQEYRQRENAARLYFDYVEHCFWVLKKHGVSPLQTIEFFFSGLTKYREACLGVSLASRGTKESQDVFRCRRSCAGSLFADYAQSMSEIKRFWIRRLDSRLPTELHAEFLRRVEPFLTVPSKQVFFSAPLFERQGGSARKILSPVKMQKSETRF